MSLNLTSANFDDEVLKSDIPVIVDFWAGWCTPCKMLAPIIEELSAEFEGKCKIAKLDIDQAEIIARRYGVMSIPTLIVFKNGRAVDTITGLRSKEFLSQYISNLL